MAPQQAPPQTHDGKTIPQLGFRRLAGAARTTAGGGDGSTEDRVHVDRHSEGYQNENLRRRHPRQRHRSDSLFITKAPVMARAYARPGAKSLRADDGRTAGSRYWTCSSFIGRCQQTNMSKPGRLGRTEDRGPHPLDRGVEFQRRPPERIIGETGVAPVVKPGGAASQLPASARGVRPARSTISSSKAGAPWTGQCLKDPVIGAIAKKHGRTSAAGDHPLALQKA